MLLANEKLMDHIFPKGWEVFSFYFTLITTGDLFRECHFQLNGYTLKMS